jgi:hypothetical protein
MNLIFTQCSYLPYLELAWFCLVRGGGCAFPKEGWRSVDAFVLYRES